MCVGLRSNTKVKQRSSCLASGISVVCFRFFIPLTVFLYTYSRIAYAIHKKIVFKTQSGSGNSVKEWNRSLRSTLKTMASVAIAYLMCWGFNQIYYFMFNVGYPADFTSNFYHTSVGLVFLNCAVNPFIYSFQYREFIKAAKRMFCCRINAVADSFTLPDTNLTPTPNPSAPPRLVQQPPLVPRAPVIPPTSHAMPI